MSQQKFTDEIDMFEDENDNNEVVEEREMTEEEKEEWYADRLTKIGLEMKKFDKEIKDQINMLRKVPNEVLSFRFNTISLSYLMHLKGLSIKYKKQDICNFDIFIDLFEKAQSFDRNTLICGFGYYVLLHADNVFRGNQDFFTKEIKVKGIKLAVDNRYNFLNSKMFKYLFIKVLNQDDKDDIMAKVADLTLYACAYFANMIENRIYNRI